MKPKRPLIERLLAKLAAELADAKEKLTYWHDQFDWCDANDPNGALVAMDRIVTLLREIKKLEDELAYWSTLK